MMNVFVWLLRECSQPLQGTLLGQPPWTCAGEMYVIV